MAKPPARWIDAHSFATVELGDGSLLGQIGAGDKLDFGVIAERKTIGLSRIDVGHVAGRTGLDERGNHRGAQCAGSAGDDDVTVAVVHRPLLLLADALHHRPCFDRCKSTYARARS
jgi:hypothetical protein